MRLQLSRFLSTGFYSGLVPISPGTAGSATCVALWMAATHWLGWPSDWPDTALLALLTLLVGLISSNYYIKSLASETSGDTDEHLDPGCVVIDEWAGMLITLCGASHLSAKEVIAAFVLFRLFDILKPPPVSTAEKFPGAWGVMFDDVVAGFLALGVLSILLNLSLF